MALETVYSPSTRLNDLFLYLLNISCCLGMAGMAIRQRVEGGQGLDRRAICMRLGGHHHLPWRVVSVILGPCGFFRRFKGPLIGVLLHDLQ